MNRIFLLGLLGCYCASSVLAEEAWIRDRMVPIGDLIQELASFLQEHPDNAAAAIGVSSGNNTEMKWK